MTRYDVTDTVSVGAPAGRVWDALLAELEGSARWWVPSNTFTPGPVAPASIGGSVDVTVHPRGVGNGGPKLRFSCVTVQSEPGVRLVQEYVSGAFRGTGEFTLQPADDGGTATQLSMRFRADPTENARLLSRLVDIGQEHSRSTRAAFSRLDELLAAEAASSAAADSRAGASTQMRSLRVATDDGAQLAVTTMRPSTVHRRPTVILVHGWGAGRPIWQKTAALLVNAGHEVVLYDQRGHGDSTLGSDPLTIARLAGDLATVADATDAPEAIVVGHSGGGTAALAYAATAGTRPAGLVLASGAAHGQETPAAELRMMGSTLFTRALESRIIGRRLLTHTLARFANADDLETVRRLFAATPAAVRRACFASTRGMDLRASLRQLECPVAVLAGSEDRVVAPALTEETARAVPNSTFELLHGVGHMSPLESPARLVRAISALSQRALAP